MLIDGVLLVDVDLKEFIMSFTLEVLVASHSMLVTTKARADLAKIDGARLRVQLLKVGLNQVVLGDLHKSVVMGDEVSLALQGPVVHLANKLDSEGGIEIGKIHLGLLSSDVPWVSRPSHESGELGFVLEVLWTIGSNFPTTEKCRHSGCRKLLGFLR